MQVPDVRTATHSTVGPRPRPGDAAAVPDVARISAPWYLTDLQPPSALFASTTPPPAAAAASVGTDRGLEIQAPDEVRWRPVRSLEDSRTMYALEVAASPGGVQNPALAFALLRLYALGGQVEGSSNIYDAYRRGGASGIEAAVGVGAPEVAFDTAPSWQPRVDALPRRVGDLVAKFVPFKTVGNWQVSPSGLHCGPDSEIIFAPFDMPENAVIRMRAHDGTLKFRDEVHKDRWGVIQIAEGGHLVADVADWGGSEPS